MPTSAAVDLVAKKRGMIRILCCRFLGLKSWFAHLLFFILITDTVKIVVLDPRRMIRFSQWCGSGSGRIRIHLWPWIRIRIKRYKMKGKAEFNQQSFGGIFLRKFYSEISLLSWIRIRVYQILLIRIRILSHCTKYFKYLIQTEAKCHHNNLSS